MEDKLIVDFGFEVGFSAAWRDPVPPLSVEGLPGQVVPKTVFLFLNAQILIILTDVISGHFYRINLWKLDVVLLAVIYQPLSA